MRRGETASSGGGEGAGELAKGLSGRSVAATTRRFAASSSSPPSSLRVTQRRRQDGPRSRTGGALGGDSRVQRVPASASDDDPLDHGGVGEWTGGGSSVARPVSRPLGDGRALRHTSFQAAGGAKQASARIPALCQWYGSAARRMIRPH